LPEASWFVTTSVVVRDGIWPDLVEADGCELLRINRLAGADVRRIEHALGRIDDDALRTTTIAQRGDPAQRAYPGGSFLAA
jgi:hypothetical protein